MPIRETSLPRGRRPWAPYKVSCPAKVRHKDGFALDGKCLAVGLECPAGGMEPRFVGLERPAAGLERPAAA